LGQDNARVGNWLGKRYQRRQDCYDFVALGIKTERKEIVWVRTLYSPIWASGIGSRLYSILFLALHAVSFPIIYLFFASSMCTFRLFESFSPPLSEISLFSFGPRLLFMLRQSRFRETLLRTWPTLYQNAGCLLYLAGRVEYVAW
jgi:hypothetical protein